MMLAKRGVSFKPDSRQSWIIAGCVMFIQFWVYAVPYSDDYVVQLLSHRLRVSLDESFLPYTTCYIVGCLTAPFGGMLTRFCVKTTLLIGTITGALAVILCFFFLGMFSWTILIGVTLGIATGFIKSSCVLIINASFRQYRSLGNGFAQLGEALAAWVAAPIMKQLAHYYSIEGCTLIIGGMILNCVLAAHFISSFRFEYTDEPEEEPAFVEFFYKTLSTNMETFSKKEETYTRDRSHYESADGINSEQRGASDGKVSHTPSVWSLTSSDTYCCYEKPARVKIVECKATIEMRGSLGVSSVDISSMDHKHKAVPEIVVDETFNVLNETDQLVKTQNPTVCTDRLDSIRTCESFTSESDIGLTENVQDASDAWKKHIVFTFDQPENTDCDSSDDEGSAKGSTLSGKTTILKKIFDPLLSNNGDMSSTDAVFDDEYLMTTMNKNYTDHSLLTKATVATFSCPTSGESQQVSDLEEVKNYEKIDDDSLHISREDLLKRRYSRLGQDAIMRQLEESKKPKASIWRILKHPNLLLISFASAVGYNCVFVFATKLTDVLEDKHLSVSLGDKLLPLYFIGNITACAACGWLTDEGYVRVRKAIAVNFLVLGVMLLVVTLHSNANTLAIQSLLIGWAYGQSTILYPVLLVRSCGTASCGLAIGLATFFTGVGTLIRPLVSDFFGEYFGSEDLMFNFQGVLAVIVAALFMTERRFEQALAKSRRPRTHTI